MKSTVKLIRLRLEMLTSIKTITRITVNLESIVLEIWERKLSSGWLDLVCSCFGLLIVVDIFGHLPDLHYVVF